MPSFMETYRTNKEELIQSNPPVQSRVGTAHKELDAQKSNSLNP